MRPGRASAESIGGTLLTGIGGQIDFMRGAVLAPAGKSTLALQSTAKDVIVSRIVPCLSEGARATLTRDDVHWAVTPSTAWRTFTARASASVPWI
jgi:acyl-CoA hydrolase